MEITNQQARRFTLAHQGLWPPHALQGKAGVLEYIRRVNCIQFDPLNIVGQNPQLALQARVAHFQPRMLEELLYQDRALLDGWDKNMSIYPVDDWPYFQRYRDAARQGLDDPSRPVQVILPQVREAIEVRGPLSSIDLDFDQAVDWSWAPTRLARAALESMYFWGELIVHHKVNTRKIYDFASKHLAEELLSAPDPNPTEEGYHDWLVHRRVGSVGMLASRAGDAWLGMSGIKSKQRLAAFSRLLEAGKVIEVHIEGLEPTFYIRSEDKETMDRVGQSVDSPPKAAILAPLDNLLWDRRFVKELFGFYYLWEVYKPVAERRWGYYVLPILYGDRFVARFEPGRDKKSPTLQIKNWWWEEGVIPSADMRSALRDCFERFLGYLGKKVLQIDPKASQDADLDWLVTWE